MSKLKINLRRHERCLLTDIAPYETPVLYSNWGSYYAMLLINKRTSLPKVFREIFENRTSSRLKYSIPFDFYIKKGNEASSRKISLIHPYHSAKIVNLYRQYDLLITRLCTRSRFSIRAPHRIAKHYIKGKSIESAEASGIEDLLSAESQYASSYFSYNRFSHLHKFFDSEEFLELEKKYGLMTHLDIVKCFPSIYTHSISWAYRGKQDAKRIASDATASKGKFDCEFDKLLQEINYNETNGIVVGPELSRIFAEIILQRIDATLERSLSEEGLVMGRDYWCIRYIDDFYLFTNSSSTIDLFSRHLHKSLESYKLYLNSSKSTTTPRPFITPVSVAKMEVKGFCSQLFARAANGSSINHKHELNTFRAMIKKSGGSVGDVSSLFLSSLKGGFASLEPAPVKDYFAFASLIIDLMFYCLTSSPKVADSYKICSIITIIDHRLKRFDAISSRPVYDKISYEVRSFVESGVNLGATLEVMNLLIVTRGRFDALISQDVILNLINSINKTSKLSYFNITSLLYFAGNRPEYTKVKAILLRETSRILTNGNFVINSDCAHLLIDLMPCPFIKKTTKIILLKRACRTASLAVSEIDLSEFYNLSSQRSWYFNWNKKDNIKLFLQKKEYMPSY